MTVLQVKVTLEDQESISHDKEAGKIGHFFRLLERMLEYFRIQSLCFGRGSRPIIGRSEVLLLRGSSSENRRSQENEYE
jgi:hypothetical protein